ncbi:MAG: sigma-70 family RNA polymerase sigma factor, partial [Patescibacteria group bacterium]
SPQRETAAAVDLELVRKYLLKLSAQQRDIVTMRVWDDLTHREIAEILGTSEANCKMIFSRVLVKLKEEMPVLLMAFLALVVN